jgi:transcription elongation factor GreA
MTNRLPTIQVTKEYFEKSQLDLERLSKYREEVLVRLQAAREKGDLSENGAYTAARFELSDTDRQLKRLRFLLRFGKAVEVTNTGKVSFGNQVTVGMGSKELTFTLVSKHESDPEKRKLSVNSPLGSALMGKKVGEKVTVKAPAGEITYMIVKIE